MNKISVFIKYSTDSKVFFYFFLYVINMSYKYKDKIRGETGMITRRSLITSFVSTASIVVAAPVFSKAPGFLRGAGDIRKIRFRNFNTGEFINSASG